MAIRLILASKRSDQPLQGEFSNWHAPVHTNHRLSRRAASGTTPVHSVSQPTSISVMYIEKQLREQVTR